MKIQLTRSKSSRERYYLINGSMGSSGTPANHANRKYEIANGIDRGHGYQGYSAVSYFLTEKHIPQSAKDKVIAICEKEGLVYSD